MVGAHELLAFGLWLLANSITPTFNELTWSTKSILNFQFTCLLTSIHTHQRLKANGL